MVAIDDKPVVALVLGAFDPTDMADGLALLDGAAAAEGGKRQLEYLLIGRRDAG